MVPDGVVMESILTKSKGPQKVRKHINCNNFSSGGHINDAKSTINVRPMPFMLDKHFTSLGNRQPHACKTSPMFSILPLRTQR